jgi:hypothetical protein
MGTDVLRSLAQKQQEQQKEAGLVAAEHATILSIQQAKTEQEAREAAAKEMRKIDLPGYGHGYTAKVQQQLDTRLQQLKTTQVIPTISQVTAPIDTSNYILLDTKEYVNKVEFSKLSPEDQIRLKELGVSGFNNYYQQQQARFSTENIQLKTGEYIPKADYDKLDATNQNLLMTKGIKAFNDYQSEQLATFKANNIQLKTGEYIPKTEYSNLPAEWQRELSTRGTTGFNTWLRTAYGGTGQLVQATNPDGTTTIYGATSDPNIGLDVGGNQIWIGGRWPDNVKTMMPRTSVYPGAWPTEVSTFKTVPAPTATYTGTPTSLGGTWGRTPETLAVQATSIQAGLAPVISNQSQEQLQNSISSLKGTELARYNAAMQNIQSQQGTTAQKLAAYAQQLQGQYQQAIAQRTVPIITDKEGNELVMLGTGEYMYASDFKNLSSTSQVKALVEGIEGIYYKTKKGELILKEWVDKNLDTIRKNRLINEGIKSLQQLEDTIATEIRMIITNLDNNYKIVDEQGKPGYDIAKFLRDTPQNESWLIRAGFTETNIAQAKEYNNQPWVKTNVYETWWNKVKEAGGDNLVSLTSESWQKQNSKLVAEGKKLLAEDKIPASIKEPPISLDTFISEYMTARDLQPAGLVSIIAGVKQQERKEARDAAILQYMATYGGGEFVKSLATSVTEMIFPPAKALKPEYTLNDVTPLDWGIGAAQIITLGAAKVATPLIGLVANTKPMLAKAIATGVHAIQGGLGVVMTAETAANWNNMNEIEQVLAVCFDGLLIGSAVHGIVGTYKPAVSGKGIGTTLSGEQMTGGKTAKSSLSRISKSVPQETALERQAGAAKEMSQLFGYTEDLVKLREKFVNSASTISKSPEVKTAMKSVSDAVASGNKAEIIKAGKQLEESATNIPKDLGGEQLVSKAKLLQSNADDFANLIKTNESPASLQDIIRTLNINDAYISSAADIVKKAKIYTDTIAPEELGNINEALIRTREKLGIESKIDYSGGKYIPSEISKLAKTLEIESIEGKPPRGMFGESGGDIQKPSKPPKTPSGESKAPGMPGIATKVKTYTRTAIEESTAERQALGTMTYAERAKLYTAGEEDAMDAFQRYLEDYQRRLLKKPTAATTEAKPLPKTETEPTPKVETVPKTKTETKPTEPKLLIETQETVATVITEPKPAVKPEVIPIPKPLPIPEPKPLPQPKPTPKIEPAPEPRPAPIIPKISPRVSPLPIVEPKILPRPIVIPSTLPIPLIIPKPEPSPIPSTIPLPSSQPIITPMPSPQPTTIPQPLPLPTPSPVTSPTSSPTPAPLPLVQPQLQPQPSSQPQPFPKASPLPSPQPRPQPAPYPSPLPIPSPQPQPLPQPQPKIPVPKPTKTPTKIPPPPFIIKVSGFEELTKKQKEASIAWKQGWAYHLIYPPWNAQNVLHSKEPFPGVKVHSGPGSASKSLAQVRGESLPDKLLWDLGIVDITFSKGYKNKVGMVYKSDVGDKSKIRKPIGVPTVAKVKRVAITPTISGVG